MLGAMKWWQRLQEAIDDLGWSKAELQRRSGISYDSINKYLRGEVDNPRGNVLDKLAETIGRPALWLKEGVGGEPPELTKQNSRSTVAAVRATVEAGAWREVDQFDQSEPEWVAIDPDPRFPDVTHDIYRVAGDSMNRLEPNPITPGSRVVALRYDEISNRYPLRDGLIVVVQRAREGGHILELSIKQVAWFNDRIEFQPRSSNPAHKPIVVEHDAWEDNGMTVEIVGLVTRIMHDLLP